MLNLSSLKKFFVTGGAGFIGSHLVDRMLSEGKTVTVYDNMCQGRRFWLDSHKNTPSFNFIKGDLQDLKTLTNAMQGHEFVWHLGANADIPGGIKQPDLDLKNGTIATWNVLEAMRQNKINKVVYTSSSTVYGQLSMSRVSESMGPLLPLSLYGASKLAGEALMSSFSALYGIQAWIFRFGNVMGGRMNHGVVYDFIHKLVKNPKELEVLGDGNQEKNFFMVEECIEGMYTVVQKTEKPFDVFNLGNESTIKVKDIAKIVMEEMGLPDAKIHYTGGAGGWPGDVPAVIYNVEKAAKAGWKAKNNSAQAIRICTQRLLKEVEVPAAK